MILVKLLQRVEKLLENDFIVNFSDDENVDNWGIVELQGELESRTGGSLFNQFVGDLHFSIQSNGVPILIIGHHILYGKCVTMEKPYAILRRSRQENTEYHINAIVKKKLVFKIRPKPIIANVPGGK